MKFLTLLSVLSVCFSIPTASWGKSAAYGVDPLPPVAWQESVTPGFEPTVESVLVRMVGREHRPSEDEIESYWQSWGPEAVNVLKKLSASEAWGEFEKQIDELLLLSELPEARRCLADKLMEAAADIDPDDENRRPETMVSFLCPQFGEHFGKDAIATLVELLEKVKVSWIAQDILVGLLNTKTKDGERVASNTLDVWEASADPQWKRAAGQILLRSEDIQNLRRAQRIAESLGPEAEAFKRKVEHMMGRWRAQQPMAEVLDEK